MRGCVLFRTTPQVSSKFGVKKGDVEALQERAAKFAAMVSSFCERLGWSDLEMLLSKFQARLHHGIRQEVVALTTIPWVKGHRARLLYKAGLRTVEAVAAADVDRISEILAGGANHAGRGGAENEANRRIERRAARFILEGARARARRSSGPHKHVACACAYACACAAALCSRGERAANNFFSSQCFGLFHSCGAALTIASTTYCVFWCALSACS